MRGLELARAYYEEYGREWIRREFPEYEHRIAVGLAGEGSECFGFDDGISRDHDFEPGFCLWISAEDEQVIGFKLMRGYKRLPDEYMGIRRQAVSLFGANRRGVHEIGEFYRNFTGFPGAPESLMQWLTLPEHALACAVNGQVFTDGLGEFTRIRNQLAAGYPEDVRLKKISARAVVMAQSGQYNFRRCAKRGDYGAAAMALHEFVMAAVSMGHLLANRYTPYYKWAFRSLRALENEAGDCLLSPGALADSLERLLIMPTDAETEKQKAEIVEQICAGVIGELKDRGVTGGSWDYLEPHGLEILEHIKDPMLRTLHVMEG